MSEIRQPTPDGLTRIVRFLGGYACSAPRGDPRSHGIAAPEIAFILLGPLGAVQWRVMTNWYPQHANYDSDALSRTSRRTSGLIATDLGYHSPRPMYDEQKGLACDLLPEGHCFYDGSMLNAEPHIQPFIHDPGYVWSMLLGEYGRRFLGGVTETLSEQGS